MDRWIKNSRQRSGRDDRDRDQDRVVEEGAHAVENLDLDHDLDLDRVHAEENPDRVVEAVPVGLNKKNAVEDEVAVKVAKYSNVDTNHPN